MGRLYQRQDLPIMKELALLFEFLLLLLLLFCCCFVTMFTVYRCSSLPPRSWNRQELRTLLELQG